MAWPQADIARQPTGDWVCAGSRSLSVAFGHQQIGLMSGAGTAVILADVLEAKTPAIDVAPFPARALHAADLTEAQVFRWISGVVPSPARSSSNGRHPAGDTQAGEWLHGWRRHRAACSRTPKGSRASLARFGKAVLLGLQEPPPFDHGQMFAAAGFLLPEMYFETRRCLPYRRLEYPPESRSGQCNRAKRGL